MTQTYLKELLHVLREKGARAHVEGSSHWRSMCRNQLYYEIGTVVLSGFINESMFGGSELDIGTSFLMLYLLSP